MSSRLAIMLAVTVDPLLPNDTASRKKRAKEKKMEACQKTNDVAFTGKFI